MQAGNMLPPSAGVCLPFPSLSFPFLPLCLSMCPGAFEINISLEVRRGALSLWVGGLSASCLGHFIRYPAVTPRSNSHRSDPLLSAPRAPHVCVYAREVISSSGLRARWKLLCFSL